MIYADFENILVPEDNRKRNPDESYAVKNVLLAIMATIAIIDSMIEESKYCCDAIKKHFNKELVMTKENNEDFENSAKC